MRAFAGGALLLIVLCPLACSQHSAAGLDAGVGGGDAGNASGIDAGGVDAGGRDVSGSDAGFDAQDDDAIGADGGDTQAACPGQSLLALPTDPSARGPWPVGAKTVTLAGLTTEVWYPAPLGSDAGQPKVRYDIREHLPTDDAVKIPDADNPWQDCDCVRDLPLDEQHGPYPLVLFVHGTAAFRTQSLTFMTHWVSRGFVVVAADHPGIQLKDILASPLGLPGSSDQAGDATKLLDALASPTGEVAFLAGHIDQARLALSGHSAGGNAISGFGNRAAVLMPMAAGGTKAGTTLVSSLIMGAGNDGIDNYSNVTNGYTSSPTKKRMVGVGGNAGHLTFSDLCAIGASGGGILQIAQDHGVSVPLLIAALARDGCKTGQLPPADGWHIVNFATSAVLEETLQCSSTSAAQIASIQTAVPNVQEYREAL
jgi:hypothetical protein